MKLENEPHKLSSGFKVPNDYFENLETQVLRTIDLNSKVEAAGFKVPENYFSSVEDRVIKNLRPPSETKVISLWNWKTVVSISAIAASLVLMFNVVLNKPEADSFKSLETNSIASYLSEEDFSTYELASILDYESLSTDDFVNQEIPKQNIEDYLLDQTDLDNLILD